MVDVVDVAGYDAFDVFLFFQAGEFADYCVEAVAFDLDFEVGNSQSLGLQLSHRYAMENVGFHVNVGDEVYNLMALLDYLVKCRAAVFAAAPVNDNSHVTAPLTEKVRNMNDY